MRISFAGAALVLALTGCASTQTALSRPVTGVYHSTSSAKQVAFCLAEKNHASVMDRDDGSRVVVLKDGYGGASLVFSVYPEGTGSRTEYRRQLGTLGHVWKQCVGEKQEG